MGELLDVIGDVVGSYGLFIGVVCILSILWLIPFGIKYFKSDGTGYSEFCAMFNITEHGFGFITFEWSGFSRYLPKQLFAMRNSMNVLASRFFKISFMIGVYLSMIMLVICAAFLVFHLFYFVFGLIPSNEYMHPKSVEAAPTLPKMDMVMLIPGVNIPLNQVSLLIIALVVCLIVHEFGHAIAADYHDVKVESFGFSIFYFLPSAFVAIETESLERRPLFVRLMVYCGGVWHNIILCIIIGFGLFLFFNPTSFLSIVERPANGVFVKHVHTENPLYGDLNQYDNILSINGLSISKVDNFMEVIQELKSKRGFMVPKKHIEQQRQSYNNKCCTDENDDERYSLLCFKGKEDVCMNVRQTTVFSVCNGVPEPDDHECILPHSDSSIHILRVSVLGKQDLLYMGTLEQFLSQVVVSDVKVINLFSKFMTLGMAFYAQKLLEYTAALSLGLAVFNLAPVEFLDGAKIYETLFIYYIQYFTTSKEEIERVKTVYRRILSTFKVILILNIVAAFINAFKVII